MSTIRVDIYQTIDGDTWDLISYKLFGSEFFIHELISLNLQYRDYVIFPSGVKLYVPNISKQDTSKSIKESLPPWKR